MAKHGKRYRQSYETVDREEAYAPAEAVRLIKGFPPTKFDQTVEVHIRTGLNVRHADQQLRGTIALPHGLGKDMTVAVFAFMPWCQLRGANLFVDTFTGRLSRSAQRRLDGCWAMASCSLGSNGAPSASMRSRPAFSSTPINCAWMPWRPWTSFSISGVSVVTLPSAPSNESRIGNSSSIRRSVARSTNAVCSRNTRLR